ncbi:MAG: hypothetical protein H0W42_11590 [Gemmatimonadaceae bacterium]|nr:hypothetical protein [Gemmatimonadaceae bacterium]
MTTRPTSFRFDDDFLVLLDAWAEQLNTGRYRQTHRADVIFHAVKQMDPKKAAGGPSDRLTEAYATLFGGAS